jgi:hypothetical protein
MMKHYHGTTSEKNRTHPGTRPPLTDTSTFCVDPIGTFASSMESPRPAKAHKTFPVPKLGSDTRHALADGLGVIYNPFLEQLYTSIRGAYSFLHTCALPTTSSSLTLPRRLPLAPAKRPATSWACGGAPSCRVGLGPRARTYTP